MTETFAHGYSHESTQYKLSHEYQQGLDVFQNSIRPCPLDEGSLSIGRVKIKMKLCFQCNITLEENRTILFLHPLTTPR